jgi:hypothetical protein
MGQSCGGGTVERALAFLLHAASSTTPLVEGEFA